MRFSIKHSLGSLTYPVLDFDRDANLDTPYHYKDLELLRQLYRWMVALILFDDKINKHYLVRGTKPESTANWESLYVGLKQEGDFISGNTDFSLKVKR
jgi:DNA mismatch repair protein MutL